MKTDFSSFYIISTDYSSGSGFTPEEAWNTLMEDHGDHRVWIRDSRVVPATADRPAHLELRCDIINDDGEFINQMITIVNEPDSYYAGWRAWFRGAKQEDRDAEDWQQGWLCAQYESDDPDTF